MSTFVLLVEFRYFVVLFFVLCAFFFFFKKKTAYDLRMSDWSSDVCSSDLLAEEPHPEPAWVVCGTGTGGTSATIGRYLRYRGLRTRLCVAEPTGAAFAQGWQRRDRLARATRPTVIEGIGRPRVEPGFLFEIVDEVLEVPDPQSHTPPRLLGDLRGPQYGGSTGT